MAQLFSNPNERKASLDIPNKLIKLARHELSKPFSYIYNQSIVQGIVPNVLRVSRVTPIFKFGDATIFTIKNCLQYVNNLKMGKRQLSISKEKGNQKSKPKIMSTNVDQLQQE